MTDNANQMHPGGGQRPTLRCPVCSTMVELPATVCPKCRTNLRTGYTPPRDNGILARGRLVFGGLILLIAIIAAAAVLFFNKEEPYQAPAAIRPNAPASSSTDLNEAVDTVQSIAESNTRIVPGPTQAKPILDMATGAADRLSDKQHMADDMAEDAASGIGN